MCDLIVHRPEHGLLTFDGRALWQTALIRIDATTVSGGTTAARGASGRGSDKE